MSDFPPKVPCPGRCEFKECSAPRTYAGCGGCCGCMSACLLECEIQDAYTPETPSQRAMANKWEAISSERFWL